MAPDAGLKGGAISKPARCCEPTPATARVCTARSLRGIRCSGAGSVVASPPAARQRALRRRTSPTSARVHLEQASDCKRRRP
jgi:hypothetical protein